MKASIPVRKRVGMSSFFYSRVRFGHEAGTVGTRVVEDGW